jgi:hypothetical protein
MPTQLGRTSLKARAGARAAEKEEHGKHTVAQQWVRHTKSTIALQLEGYVNNSFDLFLGEVQVADQVATA